MKISFGKTIGILASITSIVGFSFIVYEKTQIDPSREQLNRLTKLIETQEEQLKVQKELVKIAKNNRFPPQATAPKANVTNEKTNNCQLNPSHKIVVGTLNIRENPPTLNSLAPKIDEIFKDVEFEIIRSKNAGIFGLGTDWYEIKYCKNKKVYTGWISSKTTKGFDTSKKL